jgi:hypothetical protein
MHLLHGHARTLGPEALPPLRRRPGRPGYASGGEIASLQRQPELSRQDVAAVCPAQGRSGQALALRSERGNLRTAKPVRNIGNVPARNNPEPHRNALFMAYPALTQSLHRDLRRAS